MTAVPFVALWVSFLNLSPAMFNVVLVGLVPVAIIITRYIVDVILFHYGHTFATEANGQLPPRFPSFIPFLGAIFQLGIDHKGLTDQVS
ncbi:hypothetical protein F4859DRAFT_500133 [Xylaria cf. heliscus]|nr:hypothetical protein F4859DRAFT_500133 [Xylaria cf. heliscus]